MRLTQLFSNPAGFILNVLYVLPAVLIGLSFHEAAHAYVAYKMGDPTAKNMGRLTLDPVKHIDPIGLLCLILIGFGWAKPVPVNSNNFKDRRKGEFFVSIAGITMNLILGIVFMVVLAAMVKFGLNNDIAITIVQYIIYINFVLAVFNLLPIGPLDGMGVIKAIFWKSSYKFEQFMMQYGTWILIILLITGAVGMIISGVVSALYDSVYTVIFTLFGLI